jgi:carbon monoxide dehydrogenase subunit G
MTRNGRFVIALGLTLSLIPAVVVAAGDAVKGQPDVSVHEAGGIYSVTARFHVAQPPAVVLSVLTDYERIPEFMPGIKTSVVRERGEGRILVEQEAVSRLMLFSKRVHLLLEIEHTTNSLRFRDRCGRSFARYEGAWRLSEQDGRTEIVYELTADPSFEVPEFLLKRLLKRDSAEMIEQLQREISARSLRSQPHGSL